MITRLIWTIWTSMSDVPRKAVKFNHSLTHPHIKSDLSDHHHHHSYHHQCHHSPPCCNHCPDLASKLTCPVNPSPPGQDGRHFADDTSRCIFVNEKFCILIKISLKFVPKGPNDNNPALVKIMAWRRIGDKPLSKPMLTWFTDAYIRH